MWWHYPAQAVDTHIFRVGNRTGIAPGKDVVAVERAIEDNVPVDYQLHAHHWLILHGRYICTARKPTCGACLIRDLCPFEEKNPMTKRYQVVGIGNAMVDVLAHGDDGFLAENGVEKGIMQLIDMERARRALRPDRPGDRDVGRLGRQHHRGRRRISAGATAYVGKVKDDQLGAIFAHDLRAQGVVYEVPLAAAATMRTRPGAASCWSPPTASASMNTYLGVTEHLAPADIDEAMMAEAEWIFLEGYRFDGPESHEAFAKAIRGGEARPAARSR